MPDQKLLLASAAKALKLDDDIRLLQALAEIGRKWRDPVDVNGITTLEALLSDAASDLQSEDVKKAFELLGLTAVHTKLTELLGQATGAIDKVPPKYKKLLDPLSAYANGGGDVDWKASVSQEPVKTDQYALNLAGEAQIAFDAATKWPAEGAARSPLLKIRASGKVSAGATAKGVPFSSGTFGGSAGVSATTALDYYFSEASQNTLYALAVAGRLDDLVDPFDYDSVWNGFVGNPAQEGIAFAIGGAANAAMTVSVAGSRLLGEVAPAKLAWDIAASVSVKSDYNLTLLRKAGGFRAELKRTKVKESDFSSRVSVEIDVSALTKPVAQAVQDAVDDWTDLLTAIKPYLTPGTLLREKFGELLAERLKGLIEDEKLYTAVLTDLKGALGAGEADKPAIIAWLTDQVTGAVDRGRVLVDGRTDDALQRVMTILRSAAPTLVTNDVEEKLETLVAEQLDGLEARLTETVTGLLAKPTADLQAAIKKAGVQVGAIVDNLDARLAAVRALLDRYDKAFKDILAKVKEAAEKKVTGQIYIEEKRRAELGVDVAGDFTASGVEASRVYQAIVKGDLQGIVRLFTNEQPTPGFTLDRANSSISDFSSVTRKRGAEFMLLGFAVSMSELVKGTAKVVVDGLGNVKVDLEGSVEKLLSTPMGDHSASFTDACSLVLAAEQAAAGVKTTMEIGVGARFSSDKLTDDDVDDFADALIEAGLLGQNVDDDAVAVVHRWSASGKIEGDIAVTLGVSGENLRKLLQLTDDPADPRNKAPLDETGRRVVIAAGLKAMLDRGAIKRPKRFDDGYDVVRGLFNREPLPPTVEGVISRLREGLSVQNLPTDDDVPRDGANSNMPPIGRDYTYFHRYAYALLKLVDLIDVMRQIYTSTPSADGTSAGGTWTREMYETAQLRMLRDSTQWLRVFNTVFATLFRSEATPSTIALMQTLAQLAGVPAVNLTLTRASTPPETVAF